MVGSPPPPDRMLRFDDGSYFQFPAMRWSVSHFRQLMPTVNVSRGLAPAAPLAQALREDIDELRFTPLGASQSMTWRDSLKANYTDGIVVLHKGRVIYERYFGVLKPEGQHGAMSVTKSFVGTLAAMLAAEGQLDPSRRVSEYVPELAASAFGNATVRQLMDMTTGIRFSEDYADPQAEVWAHAAAGNPLPKAKDYTGPRSYYEFLQTVKPEGVHGKAFGYRTANTDALGWVLARVSGQSVADLLSERIWSRLGAEQDAYMSVRSEEHTSELQSPCNLVCRLLLEKKKKTNIRSPRLSSLSIRFSLALATDFSAIWRTHQLLCALTLATEFYGSVV